jgi:hypothetical protein
LRAISKLLDQLLVLLQPPASLHDDVFEVQAQGDPVLRRENVVVESEVAFRPGEQAVDDFEKVFPDPRQDVLLGKVAGVDQEQAELLVVLVAGIGADQLDLSGIELAPARQDPDQRAILAAQLRKDQLPGVEGNPGGFRRPFDGQGPRLARQVDQVEKLRDAEVTQVALDGHGTLSIG